MTAYFLVNLCNFDEFPKSISLRQNRNAIKNLGYNKKRKTNQFFVGSDTLFFSVGQLKWMTEFRLPKLVWHSLKVQMFYFSNSNVWLKMAKSLFGLSISSKIVFIQLLISFQKKNLIKLATILSSQRERKRKWKKRRENKIRWKEAKTNLSTKKDILN